MSLKKGKLDIKESAHYLRVHQPSLPNVHLGQCIAILLNTVNTDVCTLAEIY